MFPSLRMWVLWCAGARARLICETLLDLDPCRIFAPLDCAASPLQAVRCQVQRLHGEDRPDWVRDASPGVCLPPELLLLLRVRAAAEERGWVCPQGRAAALQKWLWERERLVELGQPRRLRLRWVFPTLLWLEKLHRSVELRVEKYIHFHIHFIYMPVPPMQICRHSWKHSYWQSAFPKLTLFLNFLLSKRQNLFAFIEVFFYKIIKHEPDWL